MAVIGHETLIQAAHDGTLMLLMLPNLSKKCLPPYLFRLFLCLLPAYKCLFSVHAPTGSLISTICLVIVKAFDEGS